MSKEEEEVVTHQAAELMGISRARLIHLFEAREIFFRRAGAEGHTPPRRFPVLPSPPHGG